MKACIPSAMLNTGTTRTSFMDNDNSPTDDGFTVDSAGNPKLRGIALNGSERKAAADHVEYQTGRNPDTELHLDGETDSLFTDGLDLEEDFDTLAGTRGSSGTIR
jgi:hypothetical protein